MQERHLCAAERYLPAQYLAIKAAALKLQDARGRLPRQDFLRLPFQVDPGRMQRCVVGLAGSCCTQLTSWLQ